MQVFTASSGPVAALEELYLRAEWPGGEGWAEARANIAYASGVAAERVPELVAQTLTRLLDAPDPDAALDRLAAIPTHPLARNIVECALLDGTARARGVTLATLLGAAPDAVPRIPSNHCIFAGTSIEDAATRAARYAAEGFREIKVRLGVEPPEAEAARLRAIRDAVGDAVHLAADANGTWTVEESATRLRLLEGLRLAYIEQPTSPGDWAAFAAVHARSGLPVMADEGLKTEADLEALARLGPPFLAHLKLPKFGGPRGLVAASRRLRDAGIDVMVGQMNEGALATAATVHCAMAVRPRHAELYGAYGIADDPARGLTYRDGAACIDPGGVMLGTTMLPPPILTTGTR